MRTKTFAGIIGISLGMVTLWSSDVRAHGACCVPDGSCVFVLAPEECTQLNGQFNFEQQCDQVVCPQPQNLACRVTGGGNDTDLAEGSDGPSGRANRYTFGGQAGAPTGAQPQPFGEWTHHQQTGPAGRFVFHAGTASAPDGTEIDRIACSDPGFCNPARRAPAKQIDFEGIGTFNTVGANTPRSIRDVVVEHSSLHWFAVHIEDAGEPGGTKASHKNVPESECPASGHAGSTVDCGCADFYSIRIHAGSTETSPVIYHVEGYVRGGNLQIHPSLD